MTQNKPWTNAMEWCKLKWNRAWECCTLLFPLEQYTTLGHPIFPCVKHYCHMYLSGLHCTTLSLCANANSTALQLDFLIKNFWTVTVFSISKWFPYFLAIYGATTISSISQKKKKLRQHWVFAVGVGLVAPWQVGSKFPQPGMEHTFSALEPDSCLLDCQGSTIVRNLLCIVFKNIDWASDLCQNPYH